MKILDEEDELDEQLQEYLSELDEEEIEELEREGKLERGLKSNWIDYKDEVKQKMRDDFNRENNYYVSY